MLRAMSIKTPMAKLYLDDEKDRIHTMPEDEFQELLGEQHMVLIGAKWIPYNPIIV